MKTIAKIFFKIKEAEEFQNALYDQYNSVKLIRSPSFGEQGIYVWEVSNPTVK